MDLSPSNAPRRVSVLASLDTGRLLIFAAAGLSFLASVGLAALEGSRANEFVFWRTIETRFAGLLRPRAAKAPAPTDNGVGAAQ